MASGLTRDELLTRGRDLVTEVAQAGGVARLLGGVAVGLVAPSAIHPRLVRTYQDLDFIARSQDARIVSRTFQHAGLTADTRFNALHGETRLLFVDAEHGYQVDVFLGQFVMCHRLDLGPRLAAALPWTLGVTDLLLTKLQIVELNAKDLQDATALLWDYPLQAADADDPAVLNGVRLQQVLGNDWGFYTTVTDNLERVLTWMRSWPETERGPVIEHVTAVRTFLERMPKTLTWRMRSRIGRRVVWYDLPEEVRR
jgi:hypothetical protein